MPLYKIDDEHRPMYVVAPDMNKAIDSWKALVVQENEQVFTEADEPQSIYFICDDDNLLHVHGGICLS